jgi:hypothetical protein
MIEWRFVAGVAMVSRWEKILFYRLVHSASEGRQEGRGLVLGAAGLRELVLCFSNMAGDGSE